MPIFPGPSSGGAASLDTMLPITGAVSNTGQPINSDSVIADQQLGMSFEFSAGLMVIQLSVANSQNWSGRAVWPVPLPQSAIDAGQVTVQVMTEVFGSAAPVSGSLAIEGLIVPQNTWTGSYVVIASDPPSRDLVPVFCSGEILFFSLDLAGAEPLATLFVAVNLQLEAAALQNCDAYIYSVRVVEGAA